MSNYTHSSILDSHVTTTIVFANSPFAVRPADNLIKCNCVGGAITLRTPTAIGKRDKRYRFIKVDASANAVSVANLHGQTYSGAAGIVLAQQWEWVEIHGDGANWLVVGRGVGGGLAPAGGADAFAMDPGGATVLGDYSPGLLVTASEDGSVQPAGFGSGAGAATHVVAFVAAGYVWCVPSFKAASVAISGTPLVPPALYVDDDGAVTFDAPGGTDPVQKAGYAMRSLGGGNYEADLRPAQDWTL